MDHDFPCMTARARVTAPEFGLSSAVRACRRRVSFSSDPVLFCRMLHDCKGIGLFSRIHVLTDSTQVRLGLDG